MPYEFLTSMEGLAAIVKKPDWFLLHDENGRYQSSEESAEYQKRLHAIWEIAIKDTDATTASQEAVMRYCDYCEDIILSKRSNPLSVVRRMANRTEQR